ncbi:hypothetical protein HELRODRAFT_167848 [Helobdella robusta]|uniref:Uncharacterized protein n=1 Tax=Helobdella robusta TaxID=6412 RepID=T1EZV6_HELRO|nr:hypothetical protein HELRODRAFT_167848 [Helobdella robusta]ESO10010.1 hypothetical protein HELRODRAFT_167848 [Helobdella robusta]
MDRISSMPSICEHPDYDEVEEVDGGLKSYEAFHDIREIQAIDVELDGLALEPLQHHSHQDMSKYLSSMDEKQCEEESQEIKDQTEFRRVPNINVLGNTITVKKRVGRYIPPPVEHHLSLRKKTCVVKIDNCHFTIDVHVESHQQIAPLRLIISSNGIS